MLFLYGEGKVARDVGSEKLDDFVQLIRQDFSIKEEVTVFQKFDDLWGKWIDVTSEQKLQNRDKIKVLVQARENLTSASKMNDTRVKGNEIIEYTITISLLI